MFSFIGRFFRFLSYYIFFTALLAIVIYLCITYWPRYLKEETVLVLKLENMPIKERDNAVALPFLPTTLSMSKIRKIIHAASEDDMVKGLVLELYSSLFGPAQIEELRELFASFKSKGKFIYVFTDTFGEAGNNLRSYYLATIADQISLAPGEYMCLNGVLVETFFLKSFLEKHKLKVEVERRSEYKSFMDKFLRDNYSEPVRANWNEMLDDLIGHIARNIGQNRNIPVENVNAIIDQAILTGKMGLEQKLIDKIEYKDQFYKDIESRYKTLNFQKYPLPREKKKRYKIGVIYLDGDIMRHCPNAKGPFFEAITDRQVEMLAKRALKDNVSAIVLRINSRGGSAVASRSIRRVFERIREEGVPVVTSMGDVVASGGYMIASGTDYVVAQPTTITGSIGVFWGRFITKDLWADYNVFWDSLSKGKEAEMFSSTHESTPEQRAKIAAIVDIEYNGFLDIVSKSRDIDKETLRNELAGGRIWSGLKALDKKLVDELGGLQVAISNAVRLLNKNIEINDVQVIEYPRGDWQDVVASMQEEGASIFINTCINMVSGKLLSTIKNHEGMQMADYDLPQ